MAVTRTEWAWFAVLVASAVLLFAWTVWLTVTAAELKELRDSWMLFCGFPVALTGFVAMMRLHRWL